MVFHEHLHLLQACVPRKIYTPFYTHAFSCIWEREEALKTCACVACLNDCFSLSL